MRSGPSPTEHRALPRAVRPLLLVGWGAVLFALSSRPDLRIADGDLADLVLRKAGHVAAYALLAVLAAATLRQEGASRRVQLVGAVVLAIAYGASDEWHQSMVPGRVGTPRDVVIDGCGALLGAIGWNAWRRRAEQRGDTSTETTTDSPGGAR